MMHSISYFKKISNSKFIIQNSLFIIFFTVYYLLQLPNSLHATHLMGGNITYKYLGETFPGSNQFSYEITLITFQDCSSENWWTNGGGLPDGIARAGIFEGPAIPTADLPWVANLVLPLVDSGSVSPPLPSGCVIPQFPCIYQVTYKQTITLALSFSGYHIYYDRCCRNDSIVNLNNPGQQGMVFDAYIPPTIVVNSSPVFTDMPVPFICVNDTTGILNTASDPDGDLLIFSFENPYEGEYTGANNPLPAGLNDYSSISPINVPFPTVNWVNGGFNKNAPFGPSGYAFINSFTGYSQYKPNATGNFVIAVEIKEYRNGTLIGITRRDMQLLVIACQPNSTPVLSTSGQSGITSYTIEEGDTVCFPITFTDADTFTVSSTGNIFNSLFTNPAATINTPVTGNGSVTANFCWYTGCNQGQTLPYLFNVEAEDNGCPPKTTPIVYSITVNNFNGPTTITGTNTICPGISGLSYSTAFISGATYTWTVTGGTIVSGQNTNSIIVNWGSGPSGNVSVTTTSQFGCSSNPVNLPVSFNAAVDVLAGTDKSICAGDTITIGGSPTAPSGTVLTWSPSASLSNPNIQNPIASPNSTTTYIATATNGSGCSDADTVVVVVNSIPNANAGNDTSVCQNNSVQLNAATVANATYSWFPSAGLSCTNCQNPVATTNDTTTYSVIVTSSANCNDTDEVTIFIITDTPADAGTDKIICAGDSVQIGGSFTVPLGATLNWTPNISLSNNAILNPKASPPDTTTYILTINAGGCVGVDSVTVIVNPLPLANAGNDTLICDGDAVQISASGGVTYQWFPSAGLSNPNVPNPVASPLNSTQYIVTVTENNCSKSDTVLIQVFSSTVNVTSDTGICVGDTLQLLATGSGNAAFLWSPAATLSANNIANPLAFPSAPIEYFVTATDTNSCSSTDSVTIAVNQLPVVDAGLAQEICIGDSALLIATGGTSYLWNTGETNDSIIVAAAVTETFFITATDSKNCSNIDSVKIIVNLLPVVQAGNDTSVCKNTSAQLNATGGIAFLWSPPSSLDNPNVQNPLATPNDTTEYFVTATDTNGCTETDSVTVTVFPDIITLSADTGICMNDTVQLFVNGGASFIWSPSSTLNDATISNPLAFPTDTTTYFVNVTDTNSCANFDSVKVNVYNLPAITKSNDTAVCSGNCIPLFASGGDSFVWFPATGLDNPNIANPVSCTTDTTTYFVNVTDAKNCSNVDSVKIIVNPLPVAQASNDTTICEGAIVQLNASGGTNYLWSPAAFLDNQNISNPQSNPNDTIEYLVIVSDANNCSAPDSVTIHVNKLPVADAGNDAWLCPGDSAQLTALGGNFFTWTPSSTLNNPGISNPKAAPADTTKYYVMVTDLNSCSKTDSVTVFVNGIVPTEAGNDVFICLNDSAQIGGSPTSPNGTIFSWSPSLSLNDNTISNPFAKPNDTTMYYVFTTNDTCTGTDSVQVIVNPLPIVDAGTDAEICIGDSAQLNASGGINFVWFPTATLTDNSIQNPKAFPNDTTIYFVTATDSKNCSDIDSVKILVNPLPVVQAGNDTSVCKNTSAQLNATGGIVFLWSPSSSLDNPNIQNPQANPNDTTKYVVAVTDTNGCKGSDSVTVNIFPDIITLSADTGICMNDTVQLFVNGGASFSWSPTTTLNDATISNPLAFPMDTTTYYVNVTDTNSCANLDSLKVNVYPLPVINASSDTDVCSGNCVQLFATGGSAYNWFPPAGLDNPNIANPNSCVNDTMIYYVTGSGILNLIFNGDFETGNIGFTSDYTYFPPPPSTPPIIMTGQYSVINDVEQVHTAWNGNDHTTGTGNFLSVDGATDAGKNVWCQSVPVSANTNYTLSFWLSTLHTNNLLSAANIKASINGTVVGTLNAPTNSGIWISFQTSWNSGTSTSANICLLDLMTGGGVGNDFALDDISLVNQADFVCSNTDSVKIIVNPLPVAQADSDTTICEGITVQLNASGGINYLWSPNSFLDNQNISNPQSTPTDTIIYSVIVSDVNNCSDTDSVQINVNKLPDANAGNDTAICFGDTTQLNASGGTLFIWNNSSSLSADSIANPFAFPNDTTIYIVNISAPNNCSKTDSVIVFVNPLPTISITSLSDEICVGDTMQLTASGGNNYLWNTNETTQSISINPTDTIKYFVTVTNAKNCSNTDSTQIDVNGLPIVDAGNEINSCKNSGVILGGSPTAPDSSTYIWFPAIDLNDATLANPTAAPDSTTTYFVNVIDSNGCKNADSTVVSIFAIKAISDTSFCKGETVQLFVSPVSATNPVTYLWSPDSGLNSIVDSMVLASPDSAQIYTVIVTDGKGCSETKTISLIANSPPIADFDFSLSPSCDGVFAEFKNKSSSDAISFQWLFGDGNSSSEENVKHIFTYEQLMEVSLTAFNEFCKNEKSYNENIKNFTDYFDLTPANVFTPNNDGKNDCFEIVPENKLQPCSELRVFNRWGELLYISAGNQHRWCGRNFAGEDVPAGTYFYIFDINGVLFKGTLTLMR